MTTIDGLPGPATAATPTTRSIRRESRDANGTVTR